LKLKPLPDNAALLAPNKEVVLAEAAPNPGVLDAPKAGVLDAPKAEVLAGAPKGLGLEGAAPKLKPVEGAPKAMVAASTVAGD